MNRDEVGEVDAVAAREPERLQRDVVRAQELAELPVVTHGAAAREEACALRRRAATALVAATRTARTPRLRTASSKVARVLADGDSSSLAWRLMGVRADSERLAFTHSSDDDGGKAKNAPTSLPRSRRHPVERRRRPSRSRARRKARRKGVAPRADARVRGCTERLPSDVFARNARGSTRG